MANRPHVVGLIPARAGSERVPGKNRRMLGGYPLWRYAVESAIASNVFDLVAISTDDPEIQRESENYCYLIHRPPELASSTSPDIEWVTHALSLLPEFDAFAILRPTSPFRTAETIWQAWGRFLAAQPCDSLRAVERVSQHPGKMWRVPSGVRMEPYCSQMPGETPTHSRPTQTLPRVFVQNASLEIAWTKTVTEKHSISGDVVAPFFTQDYEGFDINTETDILLAQLLIDKGLAQLPDVRVYADYS